MRPLYALLKEEIKLSRITKFKTVRITSHKSVKLKTEFQKTKRKPTYTLSKNHAKIAEKNTKKTATLILSSIARLTQMSTKHLG